MTASNKILSLSDLTHEIWKTIAENFTQSFWIKAEINKLNFCRQSGHAYLYRGVAICGKTDTGKLAQL
jgi:exonuclease VII large subunit